MAVAPLIYNPAAGPWRSRSMAARVATELRRDGPAIDIVATASPGEATTIAAEAADAGAPIVFVLGGDGTIREAAAGLLGTDCVLGALPGGTTNVVTRALGLPADPLAAARALKGLPARAIDVGLCGSEVFLMQASMGLDGRVLAGVSAHLKRVAGRLAVAVAGLAAWWRYDYREFEILVDDHPVHATFAAVCNLPFYAGSLPLAPDARPDDGRLDLLLFRGRGRRSTLRFARSLLAGRHLELAEVSLLPVEEVVLTDVDTPLQIDGDARPWKLGLEIRLAPGRLNILGASSMIGGR